MRPVILLNGENRGALAIVRALGKRGIPVIVGGNKKVSRACYSKYCFSRFFYPKNYKKMHKCILSEVKKNKSAVLFPLFSDTVSMVLKKKRIYEEYCKIIPLSNYNKYSVFNDKETQIRQCVDIGCKVPITYFPDKIDKNLLKKIKYPVLIKPRIASGGRGIVKANTQEELNCLYRKIKNKKQITAEYDTRKPIIQEFLKSATTFTVYVLFNKGKHIMSLVCENYRHYPIRFGPPIQSISVENKIVQKEAINMFTKLEWHDPANVHYITDKGIPKMIEINPRLWATVESSINAGLDFPYILYKMALGEKYTIPRSIPKKEFRWILFGELFYLINTKNKIKVLKDYFRKPSGSDIDLHDLFPHIIHFFDLLLNKQVL